MSEYEQIRGDLEILATANRRAAMSCRDLQNAVETLGLTAKQAAGLSGRYFALPSEIQTPTTDTDD